MGGLRAVSAGQFSKVTNCDYTAKKTHLDAFLLGGAFLLENQQGYCLHGRFLDITCGGCGCAKGFRPVRGRYSCLQQVL